MSMLVSFVLSFFPQDVLDEILNLIGSVSEGFPSYSCPQVGVLGLGPSIIREDMSQGAHLGCSHQGATLPFVTDHEIELPLVYDQPPC